MALRNLRSDLAVGDLATPEAAGLTFGEGTAYDRPGQGFSNEPFIKEGLDFGLSDSTFNSVTDAFIRGGAVFGAERRLEDQRRIGRFLITSKGLSFIAKQIGLQKSNPKISEPSLPPFSNSSADHRTYNSGINTLAQVVGQGTGLHVNREGRLPTAKNGYIDEERFRQKEFKEGLNTNRLLHLYENHIRIEVPKEDPPPGGGPPPPKTGIAGFFQNVKEFFAKPGEELYSYNGGPGSTYGIGKTNIRKYKPLGDEAGGTVNPGEQISAEGKGEPKAKISNYLRTFGTVRQFQHKKTKIYGATDYNRTVQNTSKTFHREDRVNLGNPGADPSGDTTVDLINALDVFKSLNGSGLSDQRIRDLIRFRIEAVDTDSPLNTDVMVFRAFLDSLNDNFSANYNEFNYNGRGESFFTYNSFNRGIDFSFKVAAQSAREMKPMYRKLNYLLSNTAPDYSLHSGRMRTPFVRVTIGAYLDRLPGVITGVSINWNKDYVWEIALDSPEDTAETSVLSAGQFVLPHVLDVNVTFQPIHDFLPRKSIKSPFIIPSENSSISEGKELRKSWNNTPIPTGIDNASVTFNNTQTESTNAE